MLPLIHKSKAIRVVTHCSRIMRPVLSPENIYAHPHKEQDVILWYNRALWHSIVRYLSSPVSYSLYQEVLISVFRRNFPSRMALASCISATLLLLIIRLDRQPTAACFMKYGGESAHLLNIILGNRYKNTMLPIDNS